MTGMSGIMTNEDSLPPHVQQTPGQKVDGDGKIESSPVMVKSVIRCLKMSKGVFENVIKWV